MAAFVGIDSIGLQININAGIDITTGTLKMRIKKPDDVVLTKAVVVDDASAGLAHYIAVDGDLDTVGVYEVRAQWEPGGGYVMWGELATFRVDEL
jgi:hypothetical protein